MNPNWVASTLGVSISTGRCSQSQCANVSMSHVSDLATDGRVDSSGGLGKCYTWLRANDDSYCRADLAWLQDGHKCRGDC